MGRLRIVFPGFKRRSATQPYFGDANRGLKPTATIMKSLPRPRPRSCNHEMCILVRATPKVMRRHDIRGLKARDMGRLAGNSPFHGTGLSALDIYGDAVTHGVAMGWYVTGPLALKRAKPLSRIPG